MGSFHMRKHHATVRICFVVMVSLIGTVPSAGIAQVFTYDYLTAEDTWMIPDRSHSSKVTTAFFLANGEFDASGNTSGDISYLEYRFSLAFVLNFHRKVQVAFVPDLRGLVAEGLSGYSFGDIWLLTKYRYAPNAPVTVRLGFKLGKIGDALWLGHNDLDLGLLLGTRLGKMGLNGAFAYRIQGTSQSRLLDFAGAFDNPGNAVHYKIEVSTQMSQKTRPSLSVMGYYSGDKKLDGNTIENSHSNKLTLGARVLVVPQEKTSYRFGLLVDVLGRYGKKGVSLNFSVLR